MGPACFHQCMTDRSCRTHAPHACIHIYIYIYRWSVSCKGGSDGDNAQGFRDNMTRLLAGLEEELVLDRLLVERREHAHRRWVMNHGGGGVCVGGLLLVFQ